FLQQSSDVKSLDDHGRSALGAFSPLMHRLSPVHLLRAAEIECRVDESDMRECLRKIAKLAFRSRIILFREKADVVAQGKQSHEQFPRIVVAPLEDVVVCQPEAAGEEGALATGQTVIGLFTVIAQHEAIDEQSFLDLFDSATHARIARWEESNNGNQQGAGVKQLGAIGLDERAELIVEALLAYLVVNLFAQRSPPID